MTDNPITIELFKQLNLQHVNYCVLRNYEFLPGSTGTSDLDIWVHPDDYPKFRGILKCICETGIAYLVSYKSDALCPQFTLCAYLSGLQIDMHVGIANHRGVPYFDQEILSHNVSYYNGIRVLNPEIDSLMCFLKETLNNKKCKRSYCEKAHKAVKNMSFDVFTSYMKAFSPRIRKEIYSLLASEKNTEENIRQLGMKASSDLLGVKAKMKHIIGQVVKLKRFIHPIGYTIAFMGTDGAGKTTVINAVTPILNEAFHKGVHYEHMRPNCLPGLAVLFGKKSKAEVPQVCTDPHGGKQSGMVGSLLRLSYYLLDYTLGYACKILYDKSVKNHVWIFDRYYYDFILDPKRACLSLPKWLVRMFEACVPTPDLIVCLGAEAEIIHNRKPELPLDEVERQVNELKKFAKSRKKAVWVDTACSVDESVTQTMREILNMMSSRFSKIL